MANSIKAAIPETAFQRTSGQPALCLFDTKALAHTHPFLARNRGKHFYFEQQPLRL